VILSYRGALHNEPEAVLVDGSAVEPDQAAWAGVRGKARVDDRRVISGIVHVSMADQFMDEDVLLLTDAEGAIGRLVFDRRIPPAVEMHDVGRRRLGGNRRRTVGSPRRCKPCEPEARQGKMQARR
jgi:hypothetical protein